MDKVAYILTRVPNQVDPIEIPVGYADLNGDGTIYALKVSGSTGGGSGSALGTPQLNSFNVTETPLPIAGANPQRLSLLIINNSAVDSLYIRNDGTDASPDANSIQIIPNGTYNTSSTGAAYTAVAAAGKTVSVTVEEITTV